MADININLYQCSCEARMLDKTTYLTSKGTLSGTFRGSVNITAPTFVITSETVPTFNYLYVPSLNRYYFVREIVNLSYNMYEIVCDVDVLMTYKTDILNSYVFVSRNQFFNSPTVIDSQRSIGTTFSTDVFPISNNVFDSNTWTYSIVGIGLGARDS